VRRVLLLGLTACSFRGPSTSSIDAAADGTPANAVCQVGAASATGTDRGQVGLSTGGGTVRQLACDGDDRIVGIALDMSDGPVNGQDTRSARGIRIGCAAVTIDAAGGHTGPIATKDVQGFGGAGFTPSTMTALASCPPGAVVSGLLVHGSAHVNLFLDATILCSAFDTAGKFTNLSVVPIAGSLTDPSNPSQAMCGGAEQAVSITANIGAGLDSLHMFCAPTTCE
jgi:hypothetical protein